MYSEYRFHCNKSLKSHQILQFPLETGLMRTAFRKRSLKLAKAIAHQPVNAADLSSYHRHP